MEEEIKLAVSGKVPANEPEEIRNSTPSGSPCPNPEPEARKTKKLILLSPDKLSAASQKNAPESAAAQKDLNEKPVEKENPFAPIPEITLVPVPEAPAVQTAAVQPAQTEAQRITGTPFAPIPQMTDSVAEPVKEKVFRAILVDDGGVSPVKSSGGKVWFRLLLILLLAAGGGAYVWFKRPALVRQAAEKLDDLAGSDGKITGMLPGEKVKRLDKRAVNAVESNDLQTLESLIREGVDLTLTDENQDTLLHIAVAKSQIQTLQFLTDKVSPDINAVNDSGNTALHIAATNNNRNAVRMLIKCKADPSIKNQLGQKAIDLTGDATIRRLLKTKVK